MSTVRIPTPLRPYTDGHKEIECAGASVSAALQDLTARFPALAPHLFNGDGHLRPYVNVFVNDQDIRSLPGGATAFRLVEAGRRLGQPRTASFRPTAGRGLPGPVRDGLRRRVARRRLDSGGAGDSAGGGQPVRRR